ncbi:MAG: methyltransferase domain-containing protein [Proteobacteria bacterium]|nr:methyltransferase domain-containing protein [Pseudomonadota bacterium]
MPESYKNLLQIYINAIKAGGKLIKHDCRKRLPIDDNTVDHILCSHFLEHVFPDEADCILYDFWRVLKNNGTLHIIVPDIYHQAKNYIASYGNNGSEADNFIKSTLLTRESRGSLKYRIMELIGSFGLQHRWMYDKYSMSLKLQKIGFVVHDSMIYHPTYDYYIDDEASVHIVVKKP